jgi:Ni,Fe-hydrogenase I cytochrome b subunit
MEPNQGIRTWQWVVTVIVIIILIVLGYYLFKGNGTANTGANTDATSTPVAS